MGIRSFFGKIRRKFLRLLLGKDLFIQLTTIRDMIAESQENIIGRINESIGSKIVESQEVIAGRINENVSSRIVESKEWVVDRITDSHEWIGDKIAKSHEWIVGRITDSHGWIADRVNEDIGDKIAKSHEWIVGRITDRYNTLSIETEKIKTFLLLKEQAPDLIHKFSAGFGDNDELFTALTNTHIFHSIQNDFVLIAKEFGYYFYGASCIPFSVLKSSIVSMAKNPLMRAAAFRTLIDLSWVDYEDNERAKMIDEMYDPYILNTEGWIPLHYINFLLRRKEDDKALRLLIDYLKRYPPDEIPQFLPVADLAHRNGITNDDIEAAAALFQVIMQNVENNSFMKYLESFGKNASIAIVGNGPYEIGSGKGDEIDAHDIVVRFNTYNTSQNYTKDYGKKTNIAIFNPISPSHAANFDDKIDLYVIYQDYLNNFSIDLIRRFKEKPFTNVTTLDLTNTRKEIQKRYNINSPSSGFFAVFLFKEILKRKSLDIYGISISRGVLMDGHYFEAHDIKMNTWHDFEYELKIMQDMFKTRNTRKTTRSIAKTDTGTVQQ